MAALAFFNYQFCGNATGIAYEAKLSHRMTEEVFPTPLESSEIDAAEQIPLHCFDNAINTLLKNKVTDPDLRMCIGLQQDTIQEEKVVEHCWLQKGEVHYDSSPELNNSRYFLFCSLTLAELFSIMHGADIDHPPNIMTLLHLRNAN
jgi:hypothetical protein